MPRVRKTQSRHLLLLAVGLSPTASACSAAPPSGHVGPRHSDPLRGDTPRRAEDLLRAARHFAHQGDSIRAEQYALAAMDAGALRAEVVPLLVTVCVEGSRLRAAVEYAEPYLRSHPEDVPLRFLLATVLVALARHEAARAALEEVVRLRPDHAAAHYVLGSLLAHFLDAPGSAEHHFRRSLRLAPDGEHAAELRAWLRDRRTHVRVDSLTSLKGTIPSPAGVEEQESTR